MSQTNLLLGLLVVPFLFSVNGTESLIFRDFTPTSISSKASALNLQSTSTGEATHGSNTKSLPGDRFTRTQTHAEVICATDLSKCIVSRPSETSSPASPSKGHVSPTQTPREASGATSPSRGDLNLTQMPAEKSSPTNLPEGDVSPTQLPGEASSPTNPPGNGSTQLPVEPSTSTGLPSTTSTTTTVTTLTSLTTSSPLTGQGMTCENGNFDGLKCVCQNPNYYGSKCELIANEIKLSTVTAKVEVIIHVNEKFSDELEDNKSKKYNDFEDRFLKQMKVFYKKEMNLDVDIVIISLSPIQQSLFSSRKGSIRINHEVLFKANFQNLIEEQEAFALRLNDTFDKKCSSNPSESSDALCFDKTKVSVPYMDIKEFCSDIVSEEFKPYFYGVNVTTELLCVTRCSLANFNRLNCVHGACVVSNNGPYCHCETSDQYWYTGDLCGTAISKVGVIAGVTVGLFIILLLIITLIYLWRGRQCCTEEEKQEPASLEEQENHSYEEVLESNAYERCIFNPETDTRDGPLNSASVSNNCYPFRGHRD